MCIVEPRFIVFVWGVLKKNDGNGETIDAGDYTK
jgi:hypothetical protein